MRSGRALRVWLIVGGLVLLQAVALLLYRAIERGRSNGPAIPFAYERLAERRPAPDLELVSADGVRSRLADHRGKVVLVHFWASWCPPCRDELPLLLRLGDELAAGGGFQLLAVTTDEDWRDVRAFLGRAPPPTVQMDPAEGFRSYGVTNLPDTYLVSADGHLTVRWSGARDWSADEAREFLRAEVERDRR
jgi:thiol-disulfide isomerase/thioredoxin